MTVSKYNDSPVRELAGAIGHQFNDPELLVAAVSHGSVDDRERSLTNQRLEFLGDAVLNIVAARYLFGTYPNKPSGDLSKMRSVLVSNKSLSRAARKIGLGTYLRLGKGQERMQGRINASILANCLEAVFGALYLDSSLEACAALAEKLILVESDSIIHEQQFQNYKSALLEQVQKKDNSKPVYALIKTKGPEHEKTFTVNVKIKNKVAGTGSGSSKMEAEQNAARQALVHLEK